MVEKRQLTEKEKDFISRNLETIKSDLEFSSAMLEKCILNIRLAPVIYKKQLQAMNVEKERYESEIKENNNAITILEDQLENGVEVRENIDKK